MNLLGVLMVTLAIIGVTRICVVLVAADLYDVSLSRADPAPGYRPPVWVVIPAYNEELCIARAVRSVLNSDYPDVRAIVVDDGSTDRTRQVLDTIHDPRLTIISQPNAGKANAINTGVKQGVGDGLLMVLDADSMLTRDAITKMVAHFADPDVLAAAANVKILAPRGVLGWVQRLEYAVVHRLKQGYTVFNCEYVIGGVGSAFRTEIVRRCGFFDADTLTEDIDFSMKILARVGNLQWRIVFAADVVAWTEAVPSLKGLLRQRFRWKFGRLQAFAKHRELFFSRRPEHSRLLSWLHLPYTAAGEVLVLLEPLFLYVVISATARTGWFVGVGLLCAVYSGVAFFTVLGDRSERQKPALLALAPFAYPLLMVIVFVDFCAVLKSAATFARQHRPASRWEHVERTGVTVPG